MVYEHAGCTVLASHMLKSTGGNHIFQSLWLHCFPCLQDNQLQSFPDISCHPQLTCLLLDSNKLSSIVPPSVHSYSTSTSCSRDAGGVQHQQQQLAQHSCLQVLSLASNRLTSIVCGGSGPSAAPAKAHAITKGGSARTVKAVEHSTSSNGSNGDSSSSSGSRQSSLRRLHHSISSWLPGLQVLRLSGNQLQDLCGLEGCTNLRVLDVSRNQLTDLQVMLVGYE